MNKEQPIGRMVTVYREKSRRNRTEEQQTADWAVMAQRARERGITGMLPVDGRQLENERRVVETEEERSRRSSTMATTPDEDGRNKEEQQ
ncbi:hypothetical protein AVEN_136053-1 [Araneus ventricosus]|uniref:Uncharacterized protein n=1 Tax=Araneus ventricosus TaxID=182803 RepID=A0A4Y2QJ47_ARAVE|nr:hypothetical protein AVEN_136053-1 [Araneus ventricosus]